MNKRLVAGVLVSAMALDGCASIISGTTDEVEIDSSPAGAECTIYKSGEVVDRVDKTPEIVMVKRSGTDLRAHCKKPQDVAAINGDAVAGRELTGQATIESGYNGWNLLNFLFVPALPVAILGLLVDGFSGASSGYDDVKVELH